MAADKKLEFCHQNTWEAAQETRDSQDCRVRDYFFDDSTTVSTVGFTLSRMGIGSGTIDDIFRGCNAVPG